MTKTIDEIRRLLGPIDPASGRPAPPLHREAILRDITGDPSGAAEAYEPAAPGADRPGERAPGEAPRHPVRHRRELASCLAVLAVVAGLAVTLRLSHNGTNTGRVEVGGRPGAHGKQAQPEAPLSQTSPGAARLLPPATASIDQVVTYDTPQDSTFQQLYLGTRPVNPPQLLVATVDVAERRPGSLVLSGSVHGSRHTVRIGSIRATLSSTQDTTFVWWTQAGVETDITGTHLTATEVLGALSGARASSTSRLGLDIPGPLPASLHLAAAALTRQPGTYLEQLSYHQGTCGAQLGVFSNVDGHIDPASGTTRLTTFSGRPALINTAGGVDELVWAPIPGITARLSVRSPPGRCEVTALAQQIHLVTAAQWDATLAHLGNKAYHLPTTRAVH